MKSLVNGEIVDITITPEQQAEQDRLQAEQEKWEQAHPSQPTMEERLAALEEENRILKERAAALERTALNGGMNHV